MCVYEGDMVFDTLVGDADLVVVRLCGKDERGLAGWRWRVGTADNLKRSAPYPQRGLAKFRSQSPAMGR